MIEILLIQIYDELINVIIWNKVHFKYNSHRFVHITERANYFQGSLQHLESHQRKDECMIIHKEGSPQPFGQLKILALPLETLCFWFTDKHFAESLSSGLFPYLNIIQEEQKAVSLLSLSKMFIYPHVSVSKGNANIHTAIILFRKLGVTLFILFHGQENYFQLFIFYTSGLGGGKTLIIRHSKQFKKAQRNVKII